MSHHPHMSAVARIEVKFNECDPMGIVWHGNYIKYFEEGREAFGKAWHFDFMEIYNKGYSVPIVNVTCDYKRPLVYRDVALVETIYRNTPAAKIIFDYVIRKESTHELICKGSTTQVFVNKDNMKLSLVVPPFFAEWMTQKKSK